MTTAQETRFASGGEIPEKHCANCGKRLYLKRWSNGVLECPSQFARRTLCGVGCRQESNRKYKGADRKCDVDECESDATRRGWCGKHYNNWRDHGDPLWRTRECGRCLNAMRVAIGEALRICDKCRESRQRSASRQFKSRGVCWVEGCENRKAGRGLCAGHLKRKQRSGNVMEDTPLGEHRRACDYCGDTYTAHRADSHFCSQRCWRRDKKGLPPVRRCVHCGDQYSCLERPVSRVCSDRCASQRRKALNKKWNEKQRATNPEYLRLRRAAQRRRRARLANLDTGDYRDKEIFERDNWCCALCGEKIDQRLRWPNTGSASIDHIIPVTDGGGDVRANVQAAHLGCNMEKGDGSAGSQLLLVG